MPASFPYNETLLLQQMAEGDEIAFARLFEKYRDKLFAYMIKHVKSKEVAEEMVTDIFMKLWIGREFALQIKDLGAFLHKVGFYKAMDFLRTASRHTRLLQVYIDRQETLPEKGADDLLIDAEFKALLYEAVNQLPPQRKRIYLMSRENGLTHDQIAEALHLSRSTVNNAMVASNHSIVQFLQKHAMDKAVFVFFFL